MTNARGSFPLRLRQARKYAGLRQDELHAQMGGGQEGQGRGPTVSAWERGEKVPDGSQLIPLVEVLARYGIDGHWLLTGIGEMLRRPERGEAERRLQLVRAALDQPLDELEDDAPDLDATLPADEEQDRRGPASGEGA
jgi:transcriptional regulator with XRE-family HTH domain